MSARALVCPAVGAPLALETREVPRPGPGEVLVRLRAAALNHRDLWIRKGQYAAIQLPCVLGSDGFGTVEAAGPGADASWVGREVLISPMFGWGEDEKAPAPGFRILGMPDDGTFAEYIRVPGSQLHPPPAHLAPEEAAALPLAGLTAYRALFSRGGLRAGEKVLVTGVGGGAAQFLLRFAVAAGAEVWVTSGSEEKAAAAKALGAKGGALYTAEGWAKGLKSAAGEFDLCVDSAAGPGWLDICDLLKPGGRLVFFGVTRGLPKELPLRKVFFKQLSLLGTTMGSPRDFRQMLEFTARHAVRPAVDAVFPLERAEEAFARMEAGAQNGKIVLRIS